jgi:hypothetical protein
MAGDNRGLRERFYTARRTITLPNAGITIKKTCGDQPIAVATLTATPVINAGVSGIQLDWSASTDEAAGERDVVRYLIYKTENGVVSTDPFLSIPAGAVNYTYTDALVTTLNTYRYTIVAQDCTPTVSSSTSSATVIAL